MLQNPMASDAGLSINSVVISVIAVAIGVVLIGSLLAPLASDVMTDLSAIDATWAQLVGVVVVVSILGLIIIAINTYTKK